MKITKIQIENFRLLKDFSIDLEDQLSLIIGKNNTGKTSILTVLDKFLNEKTKFLYDDFNLEFKDSLETLILSKKDLPEEQWKELGIKLNIYIEYDESDNLANISRVLMDLDPENNIIVLGFEYVLTYTKFEKLKKDYFTFEKNENKKVKDNRKKNPASLKYFLNQELDNYFKIQKKSIAFDLCTRDIDESNFIRIDKENISIKDIISFKYISAKRDVTNKEIDKTLSKQTAVLYKKKEDNQDGLQAAEDFKDQLTDTDNSLSDIYKKLFEGVIENVKQFGGIKLNETQIEVISTLQHKNLLEGNTTIVYSQNDHKLPENFNGLGYLNLISMIFEIEILIQEFKKKEGEPLSDINLFFIEEPEAHTHPQMQYVFIKNIKTLLNGYIIKEDEKRVLQSIISTHSSHIVADSDFEDIKYLKKENNNVIAKNLSDLRKQYDSDTNQYQFLKQYLTISRAEVFFADKAVLIEGDTERILIPTIMRKLDLEEAVRLNAENKEDRFLPLLSQNISIIEVGAYSQIFEKFIEFLEIKSLILTDIDAVKVVKQNDKGEDVWGACAVDEGTKTSNFAIKHFLNDVKWDDLKTLNVATRTITVGSSTVCICYQQEEKSYHARSFEDSFIHINRTFIDNKKDDFKGLKKRDLFDDDANNAYQLADSCIKKKTHFALDILYHSDEIFSNWNIPAYIKSGLLWLKED